MPLPTQNVDVLFTQGLDTKTQEALVPVGSLLEAENVTRVKTGELRKRKGYQAFGGTTFTSPAAITTYKKELLTIAQNNLNSYDSQTKSWVTKDSLVIGATDFNRIHSNPTANQDRVAVSVAGNLSLYTWVDTDVVRYSLKDNTTNTDLIINQSSGLACTSGEVYRVETFGNKFYIIAGGSGNDLDAFVIQTSAGYSTSTVTLVTDFDNTNTMFDTAVTDELLFISYREAAAGNVRTATLNTSLQVTNIQDIAGEIPTDSIGVYAYESDSEDRYVVVWNNTNTIKGLIYNQNLVVKKAVTTLDTAQTNNNKIVIHHDTTDLDTLHVYWNRYDGTTPANTYIRCVLFDLSGAGSPIDFLRSVDIYSKTAIYAGKAYLTVKHESELQGTFFTIQAETTDIISKFSPGTAAPIETSGFTSPMRMRSSSKFEVALDTRGRLVSEDNTLFTFSDATSGEIEFDLNDAYNRVEAGGLLYVAGGTLHHYDGQFITEAGFHLFPEGISNSGTSTSGGSISDGTYQYVAVYTWYDNAGNRHQSAPSEALSVTVNGGGSTQTVDIDVPTLRLTRKAGVRGNVIIDLYRTEDVGGIFYKTTSLTDIEENDTMVDSITITDGTADSDLISNEILYIEGGVLDNIAPPACKRLAVYDNRLFLLGLHNPNEIRYSKIIRTGDGPAFNESLATFTSGKSEEITAGMDLDANLIIFKDDQVFIMQGVGPTDTGDNNGFSDPELIASDTGAIDSRSVVAGTDGLYFKSRKGIYRLGRNLDMSYVGSQVEDFNDKIVTSGVLSTDNNEIRFTTSDNTLLVFNYFFNQWFTYTNQDVKDSTIWQDTHLLLYNDGRVSQESDIFRDSGAFYPMTVQTGWLKVANIQGFQRVRRLLLQGTYRSAHKIRIKVFTDYSDTVRQTVVLDPTTILDQQTYYGDDSPYGNQTPYGGSIDNDVYVFDVHMKQQKCSAIRFEIEDLINPGVDPQNDGEAMRLIGFSLQLGVKSGLNKLRQGRKT